ncbi:MAG: Bacillibactin exporter [Pelotomaculum sp. PtaB.Bin104]|nr:MAG: Bacillibactin exporter [Pelotomaculum sp. PtaB.Bin104]
MAKSTAVKFSLKIAMILGFVGFVTSFGAHIVAVNLPVYAQQVGVGLAVIGLLIAAYDLAEVVAKPIFGAIADKQGMKKTMLIGIALFSLASLTYFLVDPRLLILVRFLQGVGAAALSAVSLALIGTYYVQSRGRAYGIYNAIKGAGYVLSPVLGGLIVMKSNFGAIFLAAAAVGVIAFILSLFLPEPEKAGGSAFDDDDDDFSLKGIITAFRDPVLWPWFVVIIVNMFFVGILFGFLPVRVYNLGYSPLAMGTLLAIPTTSYLLIQPVAGRLADQISTSLTIKVGLVLSGISMILVPFVSGVPLALVFLVAGIGIGTVWTNTDALVSNLAKSGSLGATMGVAGSFKEIGDMAGPLIIGLVAQAFGLTTGFVACGLMGLLSLLLLAGRRNISGLDTGEME